MSDRELAAADPRIGCRIYGTYVIQSKIAEGGMGAVYLATNDHGGHKVIKFLLAEYSRHPVIRERFVREARAATRLKGKPHIVAVDDTIELPDGQQAMVMEWLDGKTLERHLRQSSRLTQHHAFHLVLQIGRGLHELHKAGVVHRDLKPGNIFLTSKEDDPYYVVLIDLGIAHDSMEVPDGRGLRTQTGSTLGTPGYMSPEQYGDAGEVTPVADLYALAVVMWEMLTGDLPWGVHDQRVLYFKQKTEVPMLPADLVIPDAWRALLVQALSPNPRDRPASIHAFLGALASALPGDPRLGVPSGAEMMASFSKRLLRDAPVDLETVRASGPDRMNALMWTPQRVTELPPLSSASLPSFRPVAPVATPILDPTVSQRPPDRANAPASPATITSSNGVVTPLPSTPRRILLVSSVVAASLAAGLTFGFVRNHRRGHAVASAPDASVVVVVPTDTAVPATIATVATPIPSPAAIDAGASPPDAIAPTRAANGVAVPGNRNAQTTTHATGETHHTSKAVGEKLRPHAGSSSELPPPSQGSNATARPFNPDDIAD